MHRNAFKRILTLFFAIVMTLSLAGCSEFDLPFDQDLIPSIFDDQNPSQTEKPSVANGTFDYNAIPEFSGTAFYMLNDGEPYFTSEERKNTTEFENYSTLDNLGRCGVAYANICKDLMPTEQRGDISKIYPSGWKLNGKSNNNEYDTDLVDGGRIYNRCHLIGFQLAGENDNEKNLITGTRYMNVTGMLPFENMIADYVKETNNHVLYRVTPVYMGDELVCRGVLMEAYSVEDEGDGIRYNIFCYNVQPGIGINYATGENWLSYNGDNQNADGATAEQHTYILNTNSKKFHLPNCSSVSKISNKNKKEFTGDRDELIDDGYSPCGICNS